MTTAKDRTAIIEALVSAKKRINFYEQWRPKGIIYERQDAEALRKIAAALVALGFEETATMMISGYVKGPSAMPRSGCRSP